MNSCETEISDQQLEELKRMFSNHLSPRRASYITNIRQLVRVLHKQNVIDSFHREPLLDIKNSLGISLAALEQITQDVFVDFEANTNNYGKPTNRSPHKKAVYHIDFHFTQPLHDTEAQLHYRIS